MHVLAPDVKPKISNTTQLKCIYVHLNILNRRNGVHFVNKFDFGVGVGLELFEHLGVCVCVLFA